MFVDIFVGYSLILLGLVETTSCVTSRVVRGKRHGLYARAGHAGRVWHLRGKNDGFERLRHVSLNLPSRERENMGPTWGSWVPIIDKPKCLFGGGIWRYVIIPRRVSLETSSFSFLMIEV